MKYPSDEAISALNEVSFRIIQDDLSTREVQALRSGEDALHRQLWELEGLFREMFMPCVVYINRKQFLPHELRMARSTVKRFIACERTSGNTYDVEAMTVKLDPERRVRSME